MTEPDSFTASEGWLTKFLNRVNLTMRRSTTVCQMPQEEYAEKIVDSLAYVRSIRTPHSISGNVTRQLFGTTQYSNCKNNINILK